MVLLLLLLFFLKVRLFLRYDNQNGGFRCTVKVLCFAFPLYPPRKKKNKKVKKAKKEPKRKKAAPTLQKELSDVAKATRIGHAVAVGKTKKKTKAVKTPLEKVKAAASALRILALKAKALLPPLWDSLTFTVESLHIAVGCDDAADTAVGYGLICAALEGLCAVENETDRLIVGEDVSVRPDFLTPGFLLDLSLRVDIRVIKALYALSSAQIAYYKDKLNRK